MDIKDFILIGGGLLIASVVAHGFWLAWRAHRDPLRLDITPEINRDDDFDEMTLLRGELPNGGARVVAGDEPEQSAFELEPPPCGARALRRYAARLRERAHLHRQRR